MNPASPTAELRDLPAIEHLLPRSFDWLWCVAAVVALLMLAVIIWRSKRKLTASDPSALLRHCHAACMKELQAAHPGLAAEQIAHIVSLQLRRYLQAAWQQLALYQTQEEQLSSPPDFSSLPVDLRERLTRCLDDTARLKYAPKNGSPTSVRLELILSDALSLLNELHQQALLATAVPPSRR